MFSFWSGEYARERYAIMARMERCVRGDCVATALCGVTDGDSEWQQSSLREERKTYWFSTLHDSGMWAMPCPILAQLKPSIGTQSFWFDLIWRLLDTSSRCLSGSTSGGNPIETAQKEHEKQTWNQWAVEGGKYSEVTANTVACGVESLITTFKTKWHKPFYVMIINNYYFLINILSKNILIPQNTTKEMFSCHSMYTSTLNWVMETWLSVETENCSPISRIIRICNGYPPPPLARGTNENMMWVSTAIPATD